MGAIRYNRTVRSVAMSKHPNQSGLDISKSNYTKDCIKIQAINPKMNDVTSYLSMEIPIENIDDVIGLLTEIKIELNK